MKEDIESEQKKSKGEGEEVEEKSKKKSKKDKPREVSYVFDDQASGQRYVFFKGEREAVLEEKLTPEEKLKEEEFLGVKTGGVEKGEAESPSPETPEQKARKIEAARKAAEEAVIGKEKPSEEKKRAEVIFEKMEGVAKEKEQEIQKRIAEKEKRAAEKYIREHPYEINYKIRRGIVPPEIKKADPELARAIPLRSKLSDRQIRVDDVLDYITTKFKTAFRKTKNFLAGAFEGRLNPDKERDELEKYEDMIDEGKAELVEKRQWPSVSEKRIHPQKEEDEEFPEFTWEEDADEIKEKLKKALKPKKKEKYVFHYSSYKDLKKAYVRDTYKFEVPFYYRAVAEYDKNDKLTGRVFIYRITKTPEDTEKQESQERKEKQ